jgi:RNA polymerase sigma factor (TIGR02999 family)
MKQSGDHQLTALLKAWSEGDPRALDGLTPSVYKELHRLARHYMARERPGHSLQATALINEAFIRLIQWQDVEWQGRTHFFAVAAKVMRRVLVDLAREHGQDKRGGGFRRTTLDDATLPDRASDMLALDEALTQLAACDALKAEIVELRFFGGLSVEETAVTLKMAQRSVEREWTFARAWLRRELAHSRDKPESSSRSPKPRRRDR